MKHILALAFLISLPSSANNNNEETSQPKQEQTRSSSDGDQRILIECQPWPECTAEVKRTLWPVNFSFSGDSNKKEKSSGDGDKK